MPNVLTSRKHGYVEKIPTCTNLVLLSGFFCVVMLVVPGRKWNGPVLLFVTIFKGVVLIVFLTIRLNGMCARILVRMRDEETAVFFFLQF